MGERTIRHPWRHAAACGLLFAVSLLALTYLAPILGVLLLGRQDMSVYSALLYVWQPGWSLHTRLFFEPGVGSCGNNPPGHEWQWLTVNAGNLVALAVPAALVERLRVAWRARR